MTIRELFEKIRKPYAQQRAPFLGPHVMVKHPDGRKIAFVDLQLDELKFIPNLAEQMVLQRNVGKHAIRYLGQVLKEHCGSNFGLEIHERHVHTPSFSTLQQDHRGVLRALCSSCREEIVCVGWRIPGAYTRAAKDALGI